MFLVDTNADTVAVDGNVSLREAIQAANTNAPVNEAPAGTPGGDSITFNLSAGNETITLGGTQLDTIVEELSIDGDNTAGSGTDVTIDGDASSRIFAANTSDTVDLDNMTITNGFVAGDGGAIHQTGGGTLNVTGATVENSSAGGAGGGIYVDSGTLVVDASSVLNNDAAITGGGIHTEGTTTVENGSSVSGNDAGTDGGGIYTASPLTVDNATIASNTASGAGATNGGGGIFNAGSGTLNLNNSANVTNNTA
ncbi:MAG: hypothetical protein ACOC46_01275, partial [Pirellulales bacterium]